jgi:hypothetical protein
MKNTHHGIGLAALLCCGLTGCSRAPSVNILGSFFPIWMVCGTIAIGLSLLAHALLVRSKLESHVGPVALFYPSFVVLISCLLWLIFFR